MRNAPTIAAAAALALTLGAPASAAAEDYRVETRAEGISLTVLGQDALTIATTSATVDGTPTASASGTAATVAGQAVPGAESAVTVTAGQDTDGANCATPQLPSELAVLLSADLLCSTSTGAVAALPTARAEAGLGSLSVDAAALVDAITALLVDPLEQNLAPVFETVENTVNTEVQNALEEACATVGALPLEDVQQVVEDFLGEDTLEPVAGTLPDNNACSVLVAYVSDAPQLTDVTAAVDALVALLLDAVVDLSDISFSLDAVSEVAADDTTLAGASSFGEVSLALPSLDVLDAVVNQAFDGPVGDFLTEIETAVSGLGADAPELPALEDVVTQVLDELGLSDLLADPAPLLALDVVGSRAEAAVDVTSSTITPSATAGSITATLSPSLAALLGAPETTTVGPGQDEVLLEGTPLESRLAVGAASTDATSASGELVTVELLRTIQSGIVLRVGATSAMGASSAPVAPAPAPLPATGGGMAVLGLLGLAGSRLLRR